MTDYIRGIDLIKYTDGTTTAYYFTDDHGSTSSLYGANGTKLSDYTYDAFGNEENQSTDTNPFRYCGEYTDQESGLVYLRARYYDPQTGRFVSEDGHIEAIYDCDGNLVVSDEDMGSYNFVPSGESWIGHGIYDVLPWILYGNTPEDSTEWYERGGSLIGIYP